MALSSIYPRLRSDNFCLSGLRVRELVSFLAACIAFRQLRLAYGVLVLIALAVILRQILELICISCPARRCIRNDFFLCSFLLALAAQRDRDLRCIIMLCSVIHPRLRSFYFRSSADRVREVVSFLARRITRYLLLTYMIGIRRSLTVILIQVSILVRISIPLRSRSYCLCLCDILACSRQRQLHFPSIGMALSSIYPRLRSDNFCLYFLVFK